MKKVVIIGAGIGGLATASLLAKEGYKVTIYEKTDSCGGRARVWKQDGFTFDMGPSWYMMPEVFERFFQHFNSKPSDYYHLTKLDPAYTAEYEGQLVTLSSDPQKLETELARLDKEYPAVFDKLLLAAKKKYELTDQFFLYNKASSWYDLANPSLLWALTKSDVIRTYHQEIERYFKEPRLQAILEFFTIFLGGSPYNMPAVYTQVLHMVFKQHIWYPDGGFGEVIKAFVKIATDQGVNIILNSPIEQITTKSGKATGVIVNGKHIPADLVVANAEVPHTESLMPEADRQYSESYWKKKVISPATLLIFLGLNTSVKRVTHHTAVFRNVKNHLDSVFSKNGWWPANPSYYISAPSKTDPSVAPKGSECIMLLVPLSPELEPNEDQNQKIAEEVISDFERFTGQNIRKSIVCKKVIAHQHFSDTFNAFKGGSFGLANTFMQTAWLRPPLQSKKVPNLYYCGHFTVPGVGFPTALISGQLAAEKVIQDDN